MIFDISLSSQHNIIQSWCLSCFAVQLVHYIHLSDVCIFCAFTVVILFLFSHRVMLSVLFVNMTTCTPAEGKI